jgi:hypothetical protein
MPCPAFRIIAAVALLICLVCPLLETFDTWDHTAQTGSDTEYGFVIVALCVGAAYSFARLVFKTGLRGFVGGNTDTRQSAGYSSVARSGSALLISDAISPPILRLRI